MGVVVGENSSNREGNDLPCRSLPPCHQLTNSTAKQLTNSPNPHSIHFHSVILSPFTHHFSFITHHALRITHYESIQLLRTKKVYNGPLCMSVGSKLRQSQIANR
jgi:hypothetical protein